MPDRRRCGQEVLGARNSLRQVQVVRDDDAAGFPIEVPRNARRAGLGLDGGGIQHPRQVVKLDVTGEGAGAILLVPGQDGAGAE